MRRLLIVSILAFAVAPLLALDVRLPNKDDSLKLAIIGDSGTGGDAQYEVGKRLAEARERYPFELVLMLGDNLYGGERPQDYRRKFEQPYKALLDAKVKFYAALGNHDDREQRNYKLFNMNGDLYYTFRAPKQDVRFFALESSYMDGKQLEWLERELQNSGEEWKIVFMHHPIYSSGGRHGSSMALREVLEPLFIKHSVSAVFAGHEHFYERIHPQKGIAYITQGGSAKLRKGNISDSSQLTARGFDSDNSFTLAEINGDEMRLQTISRRGETVDEGTITRRMDRGTGGQSHKCDCPPVTLMPLRPWPRSSGLPERRRSAPSLPRTWSARGAPWDGAR